MSHGSTTKPLPVLAGISPQQSSQLKDLFDDLQHVTDKYHLPGISITFVEMFRCFMEHHPKKRIAAYECLEVFQYILATLSNTGRTVDFGFSFFSSIASILEEKGGASC